MAQSELSFVKMRETIYKIMMTQIAIKITAAFITGGTAGIALAYFTIKLLQSW